MTMNETQPLPPEGELTPLPSETSAPVGPTPDDNDRLWAAAGYATQLLVPVVVPVIMLLSESNKERDFQRYHAVHALTLLAVTVLYEIVATIVYSILSALSAGCLACIMWPIFLLPAVAFIYYAYLAYQGEYVQVPYMTQFLRDQGWL
ncbi:MAG: DUF4870 domain-containing protein [Chloroflexi bacterium]|nr:DUF4870 domain-containing protein [Chloroflexota bacterium]